MLMCSLFLIFILISGSGRCYGVLPIISAKVPVLKVTDKGTGVECDISVENKDGMSRSEIFKLVSSIDERFQILCFLVLQSSVLMFVFLGNLSSMKFPLQVTYVKDMAMTFLFILQMKFWAKTHNVNCPKDGTMSSMAIISLVAFHLQVKWGCYFGLIFCQT
jgi:DNA polymerase sigma